MSDGAVAHHRRTPLRRLLQEHGARWRSLPDAAIADTLGEPGNVTMLAIVDLSPLPRIGFKGRGTLEAMKKRGVTVEPVPNRAYRQPDGGLCLVLAPGEVILLSNLAGDGQALEAIINNWRIEDEERTYPLLRRDSLAWFAIAGSKAPEMLAKLCAIDMRLSHFPELAIAQTSVAKMSAIVARADIGSIPVYHVLADSAAALYFCSCLIDAAHEFGGRLMGLKALQDQEIYEQASANAERGQDGPADR
jgi:sarcosine oxidase subunit gamma